MVTIRKLVAPYSPARTCVRSRGPLGLTITRLPIPAEDLA